MSADESALPPPDPAEGEAALIQADEARTAASNELSEGSLTLEELFAQVDEEGPRKQLGHMHLRHALVALPHIGETRADEILETVGLEGDRHLDTVGSHEQESLLEEASKYEPAPEAE